MSGASEGSEGAVAKRRRRIAIAAVLVLAAALVVADILWLSPILTREDLEDFRKERAQIHLMSEDELVLDGLASEAISSRRPHGADFTVRLSGSRLHPDSADLLEAYFRTRPPEDGAILFQTDSFDQIPEEEAQAPGACRTQIVITPHPNADDFLALVFSASSSSSAWEDSPSGASMVLAPEGGDLEILVSVAAPGKDGAAMGCHKVLELDGEPHGLPAPVSLQFRVPPGGAVSFEPVEALGDEGVAPFDPFVVRGLEVRRRPRPDPVLQAEPGDAGLSIMVENLILQEDGRLLAVLSGSGRLKGDLAYLPGQVSLITRFNRRLDSDPLLKVLWLGLHGSVLLLVGRYAIQEPLKIAWKWLQTVRSGPARVSVPSDSEAGGKPALEDSEACEREGSISQGPPAPKR